MRQNRYQKTDWVGVKWQPATINHSIQKDSYSCGVFVMKVRCNSPKTLCNYEKNIFLNLRSIMLLNSLTYIQIVCVLYKSMTKQMAADVVEAFPVVPQDIQIPTSRRIKSEHGKNYSAVLRLVTVKLLLNLVPYRH